MKNRLASFKQQGFTLIELLVVIAIIAILVVGLMAAIDPIDKIRSANDSKVFTDVGVMSRAAEAYATNNSGTYPANLGVLVPTELKILPVAPTAAGYTAYATLFNTTNAPCAVATPCVIGELRSKTNIAKSNPAAAAGAVVVYQKFETSTGKSCIVPTVATACP